jgi:hypothetical protein
MQHSDAARLRCRENGLRFRRENSRLRVTRQLAAATGRSPARSVVNIAMFAITPTPATARGACGSLRYLPGFGRWAPIAAQALVAGRPASLS